MCIRDRDYGDDDDMMEDNYGNEYYPEESEMDGDESS